MKTLIRSVARLVPDGMAAKYSNSVIGRVYYERVLGYEKIYTRDYYEKHSEPEVVVTTTALAEDLYAEFQPKSVIDVGCGSGKLLREFQRLGASVFGFDFSPSAEELCRERGIGFQRLDLREKASRDAATQTADMVTCFEVAEHLPAKHAEGIVEFLLKRAPVVCFMGADVGQGGTCHYNEQPKQYWIDLFEKHGMKFAQEPSERLRKKWADAGLVPYLTQNLLIFRKK